MPVGFGSFERGLKIGSGRNRRVAMVMLNDAESAEVTGNSLQTIRACGTKLPALSKTVEESMCRRQELTGITGPGIGRFAVVRVLVEPNATGTTIMSVVTSRPPKPGRHTNFPVRT